jgi:hypothetical protein
MKPEIASAFVVLPRGCRPGDEMDALAASGDPIETGIRPLPPGESVTRRASVTP